MSTPLLVVIVIVVIAVIGAVAYVAWKQAQRRSLQERFGPEYDRAVESHESRREAEQELMARQKRHEELDIRELDPETRERHRVQWRLVQERFVDAPGTAVIEADHLLNLVMSERGYPTEGYEQQAADLSVEHAATIDRYRTAHDISDRAANDQASTEDLRQAMVHYRALFNELIGVEDETDTATAATTGTGTVRPDEETAEPGTARPGEPVEAETARAGETAAAGTEEPGETAGVGTGRSGETAETVRPDAADGVDGTPAAASEAARTGEESDVVVAGSDEPAAEAKRPARARSTRSRATGSAGTGAGDAETAGSAAAGASKPRRRTKATTVTEDETAETPAESTTETPASTGARGRRRPATKQDGEDAGA
jgi:hypothetical protein